MGALKKVAPNFWLRYPEMRSDIFIKKGLQAGVEEEDGYGGRTRRGRGWRLFFVFNVG